MPTEESNDLSGQSENPQTSVALFYDDSAYRETLQRPQQPRPEAPAGLMGREVAGKAFLEAYLAHGSWDELIGLVRNEGNGESLLRFCERHPSSRQRPRRLRLFHTSRFHDEFLADPPAGVLHFPTPIDAQYAWARDGARRRNPELATFALSGVTHTLCSAPAVRMLCEMVTAPFEPYDALICTSPAVTEMVRSVTNSYAAYLADRHGGSPSLPLRLETIPLGVDTQRFAPATDAERKEARQRLRIRDDEFVVLFVGRLSHHAKAHPFPMYEAVQQAAERSGKRIHLVLAGWAAQSAIQEAFVVGARTIAPDVRFSIVEGTHPDLRFQVWKAADAFMSLSDNIQETFGLVVVEALASGLPVIASDWNGYRSLVEHGVTGLLVPTCLVRGATDQLTSRLVSGELTYDFFLAEFVQTSMVDPHAAGEALVRLIENPELARRLGQAGRQAALDQFDWKHVVAQYERLWLEQESECLAQTRSQADSQSVLSGPAIYPDIDQTFAGYPTRWLDGCDRLIAGNKSPERLDALLRMPLTNMGEHQRIDNARILAEITTRAASSGVSLDELDELFESLGSIDSSAVQRRATIAWMLKYGLLRPED